MASVDHSDFWRDAGYEPKEEGEHQESELKQIARNIMTSEMLSEAIEKDTQRFDMFSPARQDNIRLIEEEHGKALRRKNASKYARRIDEKIHGPGGVKRKWLKAKEEDDFSIVKEDLKELVELERKYARKILEAEGREDEEPYKVHFEEYEPHIRLEEVDRLFEKLKTEIKEILEELEIPENQPTLKSFENLSEIVGRPTDLHNDIVFEMLQGDQDSILVKEGPYGMERGDALMAGMNVNSDQPWPKAVDTTVHEFGHIDYRSYLPDEFVFTPVGEAASDTIDEATARLWQVHVGKTKAFCEQITEKIGEYGVNADAEKVYQALNAIDLSNTKRIDADELTYHLHIVARYEIERGLINGEIDVDELEEVWDRKMSELLPEYSSNIPISEKFLQDPHWGKGKFGYFPTYTLGQIAATQIYNAADNHITGLEGKIADGDYNTLSEWLGNNLYSHGQRYNTQELIRRASGQELTAEPFLEHVREKFGK